MSESVDKIVNSHENRPVGIGELLRKRREGLGVSLRSVAQRTGVDPAYLSRVEGGRVQSSESLLRRLAPVLALPEDELLLAAGRVPESLRTTFAQRPGLASAGLRAAAALCAQPPTGGDWPPFAVGGPRAIEDDFPFEAISEIAEMESWRKEVFRPPYHVHKWWARRLGSVFRAAIIAASAPRGSSVMELFHASVRFPGLIVFDPFMGSGTTVGEAVKLGCSAIGGDINPVAYRAVRVGLGHLAPDELEHQFRRLALSVGGKLRSLYRTTDSIGNPADALYFFWVKSLPCPECGDSVDLFSRYVFAQNALRTARREARAVCPDCGELVRCRNDATSAHCGCGHRFNPQRGSAARTTARCPRDHEFSIARAAGARDAPPEHRLFAKLVLRADGVKEYLTPTSADIAAFDDARRRLRESRLPIPDDPIAPGHNTDQILRYGYRRWSQLFNERQLLALTTLANAIGRLSDGPAKEALAVLFSGTLEFNNMFASYKGEGTGAVRHMFSHHILKPERTPIEANVWGTTRSSGAFSTLFPRRLLRAIEYRAAPFEIAIEHGTGKARSRKVFGLSAPMDSEIADRYPDGGLTPRTIYLRCGDSATTDIPDRSVHLVVTDPPFFDNVHYSELADFFHAWQRLYFPVNGAEPQTTRHPSEVQNRDPDTFARKLAEVFRECHRVLRDDGLMVFSYHHSREAGWTSLATALHEGGFTVIQCHPVKSEMSVAAPKSQARQPIDLDVLIVCRKVKMDSREFMTANKAREMATAAAARQVRRFERAGRRLSQSDTRLIFRSQLMVHLSPRRTSQELAGSLTAAGNELDSLADATWSAQEPSKRGRDAPHLTLPKPPQLFGQAAREEA